MAAGSRSRRARRRERAARYRGWYPRATFPALASPGAIWMWVLFALPFYAILSVAAGRFDPIFGTPVAVWNPLHWQLNTFAFDIGQLFLRDGIFRTPAAHSIVYTVIAVAICLAIGYPVAYCVARHGGRRKGLLLALLLAPFFISYLMRMLAWVNLLQTDGLVNRSLMDLGVIHRPYPWLGGQPVTVILGLVYGYIPYMILPLFGFLDVIDERLLEAARDLGASRVKTFVRVTLPLSKTAIVSSCLIVGLPVLSDYYTNDLLSGSPRTTMLANQIDNLLYAPSAGPGLGAAMVFLFMLALIPPMIWYLRLVGKEDLFEPEEAVR